MITKHEAHRPHCSLGKQFQSINTFVQSYDYTIKLNQVGEKSLSPFRKLNGPYLGIFESISPKDALCQIHLLLDLWFKRRRFLNSVYAFLLSLPFAKIFECIFVFSLPSPLGKRHGPSFEQTSIPFTLGSLVPSLVEICSVVLEK